MTINVDPQTGSIRFSLVWRHHGRRGDCGSRDLFSPAPIAVNIFAARNIIFLGMREAQFLAPAGIILFPIAAYALK